MAPIGAADTFIVVRPPPSASVHPLNLQIQFVTPSNPRDPTITRSGSASGESTATFDAVAEAGVQGRPRRASSISSTTSSSGSRSGRSGSFGTGSSRRLIPLYNLGFHKLTPTTITDAGTDAKIAKFLKRGVEILDLAIIDPSSLNSTSPPQQPKPLTPSPLIANTPSPSKSPPSSNFFSRVFNKKTYNKATLAAKEATLAAKEAFTPESQQSSTPVTTSTGQVVLPLFRSNSGGRPETASTDDSHAPAPMSEILRSKKKQMGYSWTVRKWLRKDLEEESKDGVLDSTRELRFEWKRGSKRRSRPTGTSSVGPASVLGGSGETSSAPAIDPSTSEPSELLASPVDKPTLTTASIPLLASSPPSSTTAPPSASGGPSLVFVVEPVPSNPAIRPSPGDQSNSTPLGILSSSSPSRSPSQSFIEPHSTTFSQHSHTDADEDSSDSDTEDSERPWTCTLHLPGTPKPIHLATLRPAPHHPKLVAQLIIPWSLGAVPVGADEEAELSAEELKDFVAVMALWITVREGLGGLTKSGKGKR